MESLFPAKTKRFFIYHRTGSGVSRREADHLPPLHTHCCSGPRSLTFFDTQRDGGWEQDTIDRLSGSDRFMESRFKSLLSRNREGGRKEVAV